MAAVVDLIYDALVSEEAYAALPSALSQTLNARSCVMQRFSVGGMLEEIAFSYFSDEMNLFYGTNEMFRQDIWSAILVDPSNFDRAHLMDNLIPETKYRASTFYNEFFRRFGDDTGRCVGAGIRQPGGGFVTIGIHRSFADKSFTHRSIHLLNGLIPHLNRMVTLRERLRKSEENQSFLRAAFDATEQPMILSDEFGRLVIANRAAELLLATDDGLSLRQGRLAAVNIQAHQSLGRAIYDASRRLGHRGGALLLPRPSRKRALRALVAPMGAGRQSCALILIDDPDMVPPDRTAQMRRLYGLTRAEAHVATALATGASPEMIADDRTVSLATVRSQIQSIFHKTETHRMADLLLLLARIPAIRQD